MDQTISEALGNLMEEAENVELDAKAFGLKPDRRKTLRYRAQRMKIAITAITNRLNYPMETHRDLQLAVNGLASDNYGRP